MIFSNFALISFRLVRSKTIEFESIYKLIVELIEFFTIIENNLFRIIYKIIIEYFIIIKFINKRFSN